MQDIEIEFSEEEYARVVMAAAEMQMSIDDFVAYAIEKYLKTENDDEL